MSTPQHRVFVISDLHLGGEYARDNEAGERGFRLCTQAPLLAEFIRQVAREGGRGATNCELVINGDFLDFLAEEWEGQLKWSPFVGDGVQAAQRLERMIERDRDVFEALKELLAAGHALTILLGNHDVELSLPAVINELERAVGASGTRLRFISDGQAYIVGPVLIEHGNRYDGWNVIDHDGLRRTRSAQSRREPLESHQSFVPPAGSMMVAHVMNPIKSRFSFVDLLKPENEATIPILLTLAPEYREHLLAVTKLAWKGRRHRPDDEGRYRYEGDIASAGNGTPDERIRRLLAKHVGDLAAREFFDLIDQSMPLRRNIRSEDEIAGSSKAKHFSLLPILAGSPSRPLADRLPALLSALVCLRNERPFDRGDESDEYRKPAERLITRGFKVVIFGHTHLAKKVPMGEGLYLNTGTWADLISFPYEKLDQGEDASLRWLAEFARDLETDQIQQYIMRIPTYAKVELSGEREVLHADIHEFEADKGIV